MHLTHHHQGFRLSRNLEKPRPEHGSPWQPIGSRILGEHCSALNQATGTNRPVNMAVPACGLAKALALQVLWVELGRSGGVLWRVPHWQLVKLKRRALCDMDTLCCCVANSETNALNPKLNPRLLFLVSPESSCKVVRLDLKRDSGALTIDVCSSPQRAQNSLPEEYAGIDLKS